MTARRTIDLNADVGEAEDAEGMEIERALLGLVTSANIACGGHVGDEASMRRTVQIALANGVRIGAHPSYPDREGFGRRPLPMAPGELSDSLRQQIAALVDVARSSGTSVRTVKAHGALYAEVARGEAACVALLDAVRATCDPGTAVVLPSGAVALDVAGGAGVPVLEEGFCDRAYAPDGGLQARGLAGAVFDDPGLAARQAVSLAVDGAVVIGDGTRLVLRVDSLCLHGDTPHAVALARAVRQALDAVGVTVASVSPA